MLTVLHSASPARANSPTVSRPTAPRATPRDSIALPSLANAAAIPENGRGPPGSPWSAGPGSACRVQRLQVGCKVARDLVDLRREPGLLGVPCGLPRDDLVDVRVRDEQA